MFGGLVLYLTYLNYGGTNPVGQNWSTEDGGGGPAGLTPLGIWDHECLIDGLEGEVTNRVTSVS